MTNIKQPGDTRVQPDLLVVPLRRHGSTTSPLASQETYVHIDGARTICSRKVIENSRPGMSRAPASEGRQRMKPWLEYHINLRSTPGLEWMDESKKIFKVPWKHVGNREWCESDGLIFKLWAEHTGRYRENVDQPDWPTWKTRFRCALTKLPDIKELKEMNRLDGTTDEPYRVYQFVERNPSVPTPEMYDENSVHYEDLNFQQQPESRIPVLVDQSGGSQLDSDLMNIESADLVKVNSNDIRDVMNDDLMEVDETVSNESGNAARIARKAYPGQERPSTINIQDSWIIDQNDYKLYITVKYLHIRMSERLYSNPHGYRIFYDKHVRMSDAHEQQQMFGAYEAENVCLPDCGDNLMNQQQQKMTLDLLNAADRGVVLQVRNGSIYATRKCRCRIYISSPSINNGEAIKLERDKEVIIYDMEKYFKPAFARYVQQTGRKPSAEVIIAFGQQFENTHDSLNNLLVCAYVTHTEASNKLTQVACQPISPPIEMSNSNELDQQLDLTYHGQQF